MPDRLVDLQRHLLAAEDQRGLAGRAQRRGQQRPRLVDDPLAVRGQVELGDQLPAAGAVLAAVGRVRAALRLALADDGGRDAGAALADVLVDAVALARDEPLAGVPDLVAAPSAWSAPARCMSPVTATSRSPLSDSGTRQRVDLAGRRPRRRSPASSRRARPAGPATVRAGGGDRRGLARRPRVRRRRTDRVRRRSPSRSRPAPGRRCRRPRPGRAPRSRRCARTSTRCVDASRARRRSGRRRRAPPRPPRSPRRIQSCADHMRRP